MFRRNVIPKISLVIVSGIVAYALLVMTMARPAPLEGFGNKVDWEFVALSVILPLALFSTLAIGIWRALMAKDYLWVALQLCFFPITYVYTLFVNKGKGASGSFEPNPSRRSV